MRLTGTSYCSLNWFFFCCVFPFCFFCFFLFSCLFLFFGDAVLVALGFLWSPFPPFVFLGFMFQAPFFCFLCCLAFLCHSPRLLCFFLSLFAFVCPLCFVSLLCYLQFPLVFVLVVMILGDFARAGLRYPGFLPPSSCESCSTRAASQLSAALAPRGSAAPPAITFPFVWFSLVV